MSNIIPTITQKKYNTKFKKGTLILGEVDENIITQPEIELTSYKSEISSESYGGAKALRGKISNWIKDYLLSSVYLFFSILTFILLPEEKKEMSLEAYYLYKAEKLLKRIIDILGSAVGLFLCLPLFLIVAILIKLDSPGPIFYRQERIGLNRRRKDRRLLEIKTIKNERKVERRGKDHYGQIFYLYKFRTMVVDAEKGCGPVWAKKEDPRVTNIGKVLRKTRIDELPQLLNVFKGEMSLVGPRPERYHFVKDFMQKIDGYPHRLKVKPGITGLAQVKNGYDSSFEDVKLKVNHDLNYIQEWSIVEDFRILLKTVLVVVTGKGAC
jgi:lipopolysaccharide/colanic/teichoic acid biosynthesis glycosyltransferase